MTRPVQPTISGMLASYHNHTQWSDGRNTVAEMIQWAIEFGIVELGISDHFVLHPSGNPPHWSMRPDQLPSYVREIHALRDDAASRGVNLRLGLEVDWFPGQTETIRKSLEPHPFDFLIGSVHEIDGLTIDGSIEPWRKLNSEQLNKAHRNYWKRMRGLAESGLYDIVAHIDLPKKFGFLPSRIPEPEINEALDAIAKAGLVVELNTVGWHKPCADAYPTRDLLKMCHRRGIQMTLSADAHQPDHLLRDFDRGIARLRATGYTELVRFARRERWTEAISETSAEFSSSER